MAERTVAFEVEQAGCDSCARRVRAALAPLGTVAEMAIDADADSASVRLEPTADIGEDAVAAALEQASHGSGHRYRVKPGSWQPAGG